MNKLETIVSMIAVLIVTVIMVNPIVATVDKEDDEEEYDPDKVFGDEEECAKKFNPYYDLERYLGCTGGIGTPSTR